MEIIVVILVALVNLIQGQITPTGVSDPIATVCPNYNRSVACVNHYAAVLPYHFNRTVTNVTTDYDFRNTSVPDTSFTVLDTADFIVFDSQGLEYLGPSPSYTFMFQVSTAIHEAPIYHPSLNKLYISQMVPNVTAQLVVDLSASPPTLKNVTFNPPVFAPSAGTYYDGKLLFGTTGEYGTGPGEQRISLRVIDPVANTSTTILNNYFGTYFNGIDDIAVHPQTKQIFFTDPTYGWAARLSDTPPALPVASYRFDPVTGAVFLIDDTMTEPNGIAFSPDGQTLYISDTPALSPIGDPRNTSQVLLFAYEPTLRHGIYAYDVSNNGTRINNKRAFYLAIDGIPDGVKVSQEGLVLTSSGHGVDVLNPSGQLLLRVQTNYTVQNFAWTGKDLKTLWMCGQGGISKVEWNITGQALD